jgi:hypothetical protein
MPWQLPKPYLIMIYTSFIYEKRDVNTSKKCHTLEFFLFFAQEFFSFFLGTAYYNNGQENR